MEASTTAAAVIGAVAKRSPELPENPIEFLSRSWTSSALEIPRSVLLSEEYKGELAAGEDDVAGVEKGGLGNPFSFATSTTSQLVMERIMSQSHSHEVSPMTSGRPSTSSGPLNGGCGSLSDSPPHSPSHADDTKYLVSSTGKLQPRSKTVGRWLKDRKERKKEEVRAHNAELHAAISVAAVAAAIAAIAAGTAAASGSSGKDGDRAAKTDLAVASAATLVAAQCVEAAEAMGAEREHLATVISSAVSVRTPGDVVTLTAAAATALRGAATLKARTQKDVWNVAAVIPVEKACTGNANSNGHVHRSGEKQHKRSNTNIFANGEVSSGELQKQQDFVGQCRQQLLARGTELLKRTRKGALHLKIVSVYINRNNNITLKMKSRHVAGAITKKKKYVVVEVVKDIAAWPGRHLLEGGEQRRYFGLRTIEGRVIEFECQGQKEYEMWTVGVSRLLKLIGCEKRRPPTPSRRRLL